MGQKNSLLNPDIVFVASLLHAQGFHILFSCCLAHFPKTKMIRKHSQSILWPRTGLLQANTAVSTIPMQRKVFILASEFL